LVHTCTTCQRNKTETRQSAGLLQPLEVAGKSVILTVVDRFSKYAHFIPLGHPYTATSVARAFFDSIVRLHEFPSIVSDRDPVFTGNVWRDLFGLAGVKLRMSTAFHPQMDDQSELCTCVVLQVIDRVRGWIGSRGRSTATTPPSTLRSAPPRSRSSTGALPHRSCPTRWSGQDGGGRHTPP
jgi:hypothetical protein